MEEITSNNIAQGDSPGEKPGRPQFLNILCILTFISSGLVSFGCLILVFFGKKFKDFIDPFLKELKELEKGKIIDIQGKNTLVVAGLGLVTADLPQGNDLVAVMRHNAKRGCRSCIIEEHDCSKSFSDLSKELRYHQLMDNEFEKILNSNSLTEQKSLCSNLGL